MEQLLILGSDVHCRDGKGGTLKELVIDPQADGPRVDYLVVHRGLLRSHDHCVPASTLAEADATTVRLTVSTEELHALSDLETLVPGHSYTQRCIPVHCVVLAEATEIVDAAGERVAQVHGLIVDSDRRVVSILPSTIDLSEIRVSTITDWRDGQLTLRPREHEVVA